MTVELYRTMNIQRARTLNLKHENQAGTTKMREGAKIGKHDKLQTLTVIPFPRAAATDCRALTKSRPQLASSSK
jgi:hypothetical protein